jgi:outer membrane protein TolC
MQNAKLIIKTVLITSCVYVSITVVEKQFWPEEPHVASLTGSVPSDSAAAQSIVRETVTMAASTQLAENREEPPATYPSFPPPQTFGLQPPRASSPFSQPAPTIPSHTPVFGFPQTQSSGIEVSPETEIAVATTPQPGEFPVVAPSENGSDALTSESTVVVTKPAVESALQKAPGTNLDPTTLPRELEAKGRQGAVVVANLPRSLEHFSRQPKSAATNRTEQPVLVWANTVGPAKPVIVPRSKPLIFETDSRENHRSSQSVDPHRPDPIVRDQWIEELQDAPPQIASPFDDAPSASRTRSTRSLPANDRRLLPEEEDRDAESFDDLSAVEAKWWQNELFKQLRPDSSLLEVDLDTLVCNSLCFSPYVLNMAAEPEIVEEATPIVNGQESWHAMLESVLEEATDAADGNPESHSRVSAKDPGNSRVLRVTLNHLPQRLNEANGDQIIIGGRTVYIETPNSVSRQELTSRLSQHLEDVVSAYWGLHQTRSIHLQKMRLLDDALRIQEVCEDRQFSQAAASQCLRIQAAVAKRRAASARSELLVRSAEVRLAALVNDPVLTEETDLELVPLDTPPCVRPPITADGATQLAVRNHHDIRSAILELRETSTQLGRNSNDFIGDILSAIQPSLVANQPTYRTDSLFRDGLNGKRDYPATRTSFDSFKNSMTNSSSQAEAWTDAVRMCRNDIQASLADVETAFLRCDESYRSLGKQQILLKQSENDTNELSQQWKTASRDTGIEALDELLDSQERTAERQESCVIAQIEYVLSLNSLQTSTGTALQAREVPATVLDKLKTPLPAEVSPVASESRPNEPPWSDPTDDEPPWSD